MKINRQYCDPQALVLGDIKHVHPFRFPAGASLGCDPVRVYIKVYPCNDIQISSGNDHSIGGDCSKYALVVDLEQGVIKAVRKSHQIIELESELIVKGPVEPRRGR